MPSGLLLNLALNPMLEPLATRARAWRNAEIPAAGGHGNARAIAEVHTVLANGGIAKGKRLMSEAGCRKALELQVEGVDLVLGLPVRYGLGFGLPGDMLRPPSPNSLYWHGYGGSLAVIDMDVRTTFAHAMNRMRIDAPVDPRASALAQAMWASLSA